VLEASTSEEDTVHPALTGASRWHEQQLDTRAVEDLTRSAAAPLEKEREQRGRAQSG